MTHPVPHCALEHTWPFPHDVPFGAALQPEVLVPGWQVSQGEFGSGALAW
jgi:hypothetical protein